VAIMLPTLLRHPGYVSHLFSMSGAFNIKTFSTVFTTMMCFITVLSYLYGLDDPELWKMDIVLGTSNWDICFDNLKLSKVLSEMYTTGLIFVKTGVMTGRYGRKCFLITYPESNFLDSGIQYERHNIIIKKI
jgi:esterase/lipase superfamily enzyme